jgi:hypothetical protein
VSGGSGRCRCKGDNGKTTPTKRARYVTSNHKRRPDERAKALMGPGPFRQLTLLASDDLLERDFITDGPNAVCDDR